MTFILNAVSQHTIMATFIFCGLILMLMIGSNKILRRRAVKHCFSLIDDIFNHSISGDKNAIKNYSEISRLMFKYNILESEIGLSGLKPLKIAALASFNKHLQRVREAHETLKKVILECRQYPDHLYLQGIASHGPTLVASQSKLDLLEIEQCAFNRENGTCISSKKRVFLAEPA